MGTIPVGANGLTTLSGSSLVQLVADYNSSMLAADSALTTLKAQAVSDAASYTDTRETSIKAYADDRDVSYLANAKTYTEQQDVIALAAAATDATTKANNAKSEAITAAALDATAKRWLRRDLVAGDNADLLIGAADTGYYPVRATTVTGIPGAFFGHLEVFRNGSDGRVIQVFTRSQPGDVVRYSRAYSSGVWGAWAETTAPAVTSAVALAKTYTDSVKWVRPALTAASNLDTLIGAASQGRHSVNSTAAAGTPGPWLGHLDVSYNSADGRTVQIFTRSNAGPVQEYSRAYSGGVWGLWANHKWQGSLLAADLDFNDQRTPSIVGIQFTNHANQPAANVGTLEILPATGLVIQRFTTWEPTPRVFQRRAVNATEWGEWSTITGGGTGGGGTVIVPGFGTPTRTNPVQVMATTETAKAASDILVAMNKDRTKGYNCYTSVLRETTDEGATWTDVASFPGHSLETTNVLDNGEIMITANTAGNMRKVYVSEGYPTLGASATWVERVQGSAQYVKFPSAWSISTYKNIILLNEYGPKSGQTWGGSAEPIASGMNARYTYMSLDHGKTWKTIFDLNAFTASKGLSGDVQHLHGVAWDQYWDRIWLTFGDSFGGLGSNGVLYSDDLGDTWQEAHYWKGSGPTTQVVGILPMPRCVLFLGDVTPSGLMRINRADGKYPTGAYNYEVAFDSTASGGHLGQAINRIDRPGDDGAAFLGFSSEGSAAPSLLIATLDGYDFTTIYQDAVDQPSGFGIRNIAGPTLKGNLIVASNRNGVWSEIKGKAPGY